MNRLLQPLNLGLVANYSLEIETLETKQISLRLQQETIIT